MKCFLTPVVILLILTTGCKKKEAIKIGFFGELTGRIADLGIAGRDGALLAVEECNANGGIHGRPVQVLVQDNHQDPTRARLCVRQLASEGVLGIVGPMTSAMSVAINPELSETGVVVISPTACNNDLAGKKDLFYRTYPASAEVARKQAIYIYSELGLKSVAVIYETTNRAYTESLLHHFKDSYHSLGGSVSMNHPYVSGKGVNFYHVTESTLETNPDALLILTNTMDFSLFCLQLRKQNSDIPVFAGEWSASEELLEYGGQSVDGVSFFHTFNRNCKIDGFQCFQRKFTGRFSYHPGFAATHSYNSTRILLKAIESTSPDELNSANIARIMAGIRSFEGLQSTINFDQFGDVQGHYFLTTIVNGKFVTKAENNH